MENLIQILLLFVVYLTYIYIVGFQLICILYITYMLYAGKWEGLYKHELETRGFGGAKPPKLTFF